MKRLIIVASLAILAVGCQKTFVENEVLTPIGFNTEVGKQTRAIVQGTEYTGSFGVITYAYNEGIYLNTVMDNIEIENTAGVDEAPVWKNASNTYYWPNDAETTLDFYAYSPFGDYVTLDRENNLASGFTIDDFTLASPYDFDFMVARAVTGQKYDENAGGKVSVSFAHQMTQVQFEVSSSAPAGVTFDVTSIVLDNVTKVADYVQNPVSPTLKWTEVRCFDSKANPADPCTLQLEGTAGNENTVPVTMIPQALTNKTFTVTYTITGTGVANETVVKTLPLIATNVPSWTENMKVVYNLSIGLKEITFNPTVVKWDDPLDTPDIPIV